MVPCRLMLLAGTTMHAPGNAGNRAVVEGHRHAGYAVYKFLNFELKIRRAQSPLAAAANCSAVAKGSINC